MKKEVVEMAAVRMPRKHMAFVKDNPEISQKVGGILVELQSLKKRVASLEKVLTQQEIFEPFIKQGTKE